VTVGRVEVWAAVETVRAVAVVAAVDWAKPEAARATVAVETVRAVEATAAAAATEEVMVAAAATAVTARDMRRPVSGESECCGTMLRSECGGVDAVTLRRRQGVPGMGLERQLRGLEQGGFLEAQEPPCSTAWMSTSATQTVHRVRAAHCPPQHPRRADPLSLSQSLASHMDATPDGARGLLMPSDDAEKTHRRRPRRRRRARRRRRR